VDHSGKLQLVYPETGLALNIAPGRPDLAAAVTWAAEVAGDGVTSVTPSKTAMAAASAAAANVRVVCAGEHHNNLHMDEL
jgi:hypothetical protein